jgi:hypothetical protein
MWMSRGRVTRSIPGVMRMRDRIRQFRLRRRNYRHGRSWAFRVFYISKYDVGLAYGGSEEGGWHYDTGVPVWRYSIPVPFWEEGFYKLCRWLNGREKTRAERDERYGYTSVLAYQSTHYSYGDQPDQFRPTAYPATRPHYE